ncbi:MAG: putative integral rane protein [Pseudonocardiales bacterium]|nr:putative integral rane protein [Pseudonocardiales bacterium]
MTGRVPRWVLVATALCPLLLTMAWLAADALQPSSYSPMRQTVSVLAGYGGTDRWLMTAALVLIGCCYLLATAGLRVIPGSARIGLLVAGIAAVGIAACPQPAHGSTPQHMAFTAIGECALAFWPLSLVRHERIRSVISSGTSIVVEVTFLALLLWLVAQLRGGGQLGLAERASASIQTCWPFVVAVALRRADDADKRSPAGLSPRRRLGAAPQAQTETETENRLLSQ